MRPVMVRVSQKLIYITSKEIGEGFQSQNDGETFGPPRKNVSFIDK